MNTEAGLLHAIYTNPDDDVPRLVYADWLEEHDQLERAEYIRVQIELDRLEDQEESYELSHREYELRTAQMVPLLADLDPLKRERVQILFERGFPESLTIHDGIPTDFRILRSLPGLRSLWIMDGAVSPEVVRQIAQLEHLDELRIYRTPFSADWLDLLAPLPPWTSISIEGDGPEFDRAWRAFQKRRIAGLTLARPERVRQTVRLLLDVSSRPHHYNESPRRGRPFLRGRLHSVEDFDLALLPYVSELEELHLSLRSETEEGLRYLTRLPNLRSVRLALTQATTITPLAGCTRLERLDVSTEGVTLTDDGTEGLERLTNLRELHLNGGPGSLRDGTLRRLSPLQHLRSLEIHLGELEHDSLAVFAGLRKLERLTLVGPTRDHDLRHLAGLTDLTFLALHDSHTTDAVLSHMTRLTHLRTLEVRGGQPHITEAAARNLAAQLPEVTIILDDGVAKAPREEFVFRRRLVGGFASALFPVHWTDQPHRKDEPHCLWLDEDGWEHVDSQAGDRHAVIGLTVHAYTCGQSAGQALDGFVNGDWRDNPQILERSVVPLAGTDTASCVFREGDSQCVVCTMHEQNGSVTLVCSVAADRFEEFRRLFLFIARSLRLGEEATRGVGEEVTVAAPEMVRPDS